MSGTGLAERRLPRLLLFCATAAGAVLMLSPLLWALSSSLKGPADIFRFPPEWLPRDWDFTSYTEVWELVPLGRWMWNTVVITVLGTIGNVASSTLVGYGFARFRFPFRETLFVLVLSTMMLPKIVTLLPIYLGFRVFGLIDTYWPLVLPQWFAAGGESALCIFIMRQFFRSIPDSLFQAARIDGASEFGIFLRIAVPLCKPALATITLLSIIFNWGDFLDPLVFLTSMEKFPISLGLQMFKDDLTGTTQTFSFLLSTTLIAMAPVVVLFIAGQKYFIEGIATQGLK
uniref:Putative sugar ABC transporter permease n=1 Tax=uncultured bacterium 1114 TaxID=548901 RepID=B8R927_9BACT|nr:putative sugar ABC transporter permease [uncultured bacterium 1114]